MHPPQFDPPVLGSSSVVASYTIQRPLITLREDFYDARQYFANPGTDCNLLTNVMPFGTYTDKNLIVKSIPQVLFNFFGCFCTKIHKYNCKVISRAWTDRTSGPVLYSAAVNAITSNLLLKTDAVPSSVRSVVVSPHNNLLGLNVMSEGVLQVFVATAEGATPDGG
jgi:hypothetical protein